MGGIGVVPWRAPHISVQTRHLRQIRVAYPAIYPCSERGASRSHGAAGRRRFHERSHAQPVSLIQQLIIIIIIIIFPLRTSALLTATNETTVDTGKRPILWK